MVASISWQASISSRLLLLLPRLTAVRPAPTSGDQASGPRAWRARSGQDHVGDAAALRELQVWQKRLVWSLEPGGNRLKLRLDQEQESAPPLPHLLLVVLVSLLEAGQFPFVMAVGRGAARWSGRAFRLWRYTGILMGELVEFEDGSIVLEMIRARNSSASGWPARTETATGGDNGQEHWSAGASTASGCGFASSSPPSRRRASTSAGGATLANG
jgi:hypothetical protein